MHEVSSRISAFDVFDFELNRKPYIEIDMLSHIQLFDILFSQMQRYCWRTMEK